MTLGYATFVLIVSFSLCGYGYTTVVKSVVIGLKGLFKKFAWLSEAVGGKFSLAFTPGMARLRKMMSIH